VLLLLLLQKAAAGAAWSRKMVFFSRACGACEFKKG
jgi:hypothetical protein